jgi:hypothetical protein
MFPLLCLAPFLPSDDPLVFLAGKWQSTEETRAADGTSIRFVLQGQNRTILRDKALQIDESFAIGSQKYENHIIFTREGTDGVRAWWFSSSQPAKPLLFSGKVSPKELVLNSQPEGMRILYTFHSPDRYSAQVETKKGDGWEIRTTAEYERKRD